MVLEGRVRWGIPILGPGLKAVRMLWRDLAWLPGCWKMKSSYSVFGVLAMSGLPRATRLCQRHVHASACDGSSASEVVAA